MMDDDDIELPEWRPRTLRVRRSARLTAWLLCLAFVAFLLFLVDWVCGRSYARLPANSTGKQWVEWAQGHVAAEDSLWQPEPYSVFGNRPGWHGEVSKGGYRGPEPRNPAVLCIGGSTTWGWDLPSYKDAWPWKLGQALGVESVNAGVAASNSAEWLTSYSVKHRYLGAKLLIIHCGHNDTMAFLEDPADLGYCHLRHVADRLTVRPGEPWLLEHSGVARLLYSHWNQDCCLPTWSPVVRYWDISPEIARQSVSGKSPETFRRNLDCLVTLARADGMSVLLVKVPVRTLEEFQRSEREGTCNGWERGHSEFYSVFIEEMQKSHAVIDDVGSKHKVPVIEIQRRRLSYEKFLDHCHLQPAGEDVKAETIVQAIRDYHLLEQ